MNFRDVIASLPAQRLLPGHGVADLISSFQSRVVRSSHAHAFDERTFHVAKIHRRIREKGKLVSLMVDHGSGRVSRMRLSVLTASLIR